ncbi:MAG: hypothetical protein LKK49_04165 [Leuconostoc mesenteroides]|jgi:hypothetical protein|nr:hypothetical protein [Leuconostoc mesenteroides]MCI2167244.1 hypothetical protein [Leuconostoc mesenteroides]
MKIVSLQSVGLGAIFSGGEHVNGFGFNEPYVMAVGKRLKNGRGEQLDVTVTEITHLSDYLTNKEVNDILPDYYKVHTSDGHIRVLPADKYIAEWSDNTDRISPDDISNDIHEFLHGGDK